MLYTGVRAAELAAIRLTDIADLLPIRITNGKGGKDEIAAAAGSRQVAGPGGGGTWRCRSPGMQREYVRQVAAALKARGVRWFYDKATPTSRLSCGKPLSGELPRI